MTSNPISKRNATDSESEDDYLTMDLGELEDHISKEPLTYKQKRVKTVQEQKQKGYILPLAVREREQREEILSKPIEQSSKGFSLLSKMGYKPGHGLGANKHGIKEPIKINLSSGNKGVGFDTDIKEKNLQLYEKVKQVEKLTQSEFKNNSKLKFLFGQTNSDLYQSRVVCEQLDRKNDINDNPLWLPFSKVTELEKEKEKLLTEVVSESSESDKEEESKPDLAKVTEDLIEITNYLRSKYFYCLWCGDSYSDKEDLDQNCPGDSREDH